ncbi:MAG: hypothetical protein QOG68_1641 [Solirubrobacteraceae bacterium]|nr:hypothetical protein [Solirubrobacteraceae bacterium]
MSPRRFTLPAFALCCALAAPASAAVTKGPAGLKFYAPPAAKVAGKHGSVIWARSMSGGAVPRSGHSWLVLYRSTAPDGTTVPVSGVVTIPAGKAPKGGWPVVSWAHGTTGIADSCAPSRLMVKKPTTAYDKNFQAEATHWVQEGFAVAQTDYQGLGTPGLHSYLIGKAEGRSVIDAVAATRALDAHVGKRWFTSGHSQGGHAVLWAAALAHAYAPGLTLTGAAPLAPASHIGEQAAYIKTLDGEPFGGIPALIIAAGLDSAGVEPATALSDKAMALYPDIEKVCLDVLGQQDNWGGLPLKEIFRDDYDIGPLSALLESNDPENLTITVPLLIAQGTKDTTVVPGFTDDTVKQLRGRGTKITYKTYDGIDHQGVVEASRKDVDTFLDKRLG